MRCFVVAGFLLTRASRGPSAIAEFLVNFGVRGNIADVITHVKFYVSRFRDFGAVTPRNLHISIGMTGGSHNSVSTAVLHCDKFFVACVHLLTTC